jgi:hypothetical protein
MDDQLPKLIPDKISECSLVSNRDDVCMGQPALAAVAVAVHSDAVTPRGILDDALEATGCKTERCVLEKLPLDRQLVRAELAYAYKIRGPVDNALLSNVNIDNTLKQWGMKWRRFYPYNFNMKNYTAYRFREGRVESEPDTLATVPVVDLFMGAYDCAGCVINTDSYQGDGKHWMALFADRRGSSGESTPGLGRTATVEFFNSSGNNPQPEYCNWLIKSKSDLEAAGIPTEIVKVSRIQHQKSRSECGLYSLFYIWSRLHGVPAAAFGSRPVPDRLMFEFRQHLFHDPTKPALEKFDWDEFQKKVRVEWEK